MLVISAIDKRGYVNLRICQMVKSNANADAASALCISSF